MIAWVRLHFDPCRTVMIATKRFSVEMFGKGGYEGFMIFWYAELVGWIVCWKQDVEKRIKSALAYETDVADLHRPIWFSWIWLPQCVSVRRMLDGKLLAVDVVFGHRDSKDKENLWTRSLGEMVVTVEGVAVYSGIRGTASQDPPPNMVLQISACCELRLKRGH